MEEAVEVFGHEVVMFLLLFFDVAEAESGEGYRLMPAWSQWQLRANAEDQEREGRRAGSSVFSGSMEQYISMVIIGRPKSQLSGRNSKEKQNTHTNNIRRPDQRCVILAQNYLTVQRHQQRPIKPKYSKYCDQRVIVNNWSQFNSLKQYHLLARLQRWYSQLSLLRQFCTGMLSSTLLPLWISLTIRLSPSKSKRVHISFTLLYPTTNEGFSLPSLYMLKPPWFITPKVGSQPPKKDDLRTFPVNCAPFSCFQLSWQPNSLSPGCGFLPMSCSLTVTILANMQQQWSRHSSWSFLWSTAKKMSSSRQHTFILHAPLGVLTKNSLTLARSYMGMDLSPISTVWARNWSTFSSHMLMPFRDGTSTSKRSRPRLRSPASILRRTDWLRAFYFWGPRSTELNMMWESHSELELLLRVFSFIWGWISSILGILETGRESSSEEELHPNYPRLSLVTSCRWAALSALYLSLSFLK